MVKSLMEELPRIVTQARKEAEKILGGLSSPKRLMLQTNELVIPSRNNVGLFRGRIKDVKEGEWFNRLAYGDNLLVMQALLSGDPSTGLPSMRGKIDLIYIDPPFDSKADYRTKIHLPGGDVEQMPTVIEQFAYSDTWKDGTVSYLQMIAVRLYLMRELLSAKGSIYVHLDWHIGHYVKIVMDEIFGKDNFRNEIVWWYYNKMQGNVNHFPRNHDVIFYYAKNQDFKFHRLSETRDQPIRQQKRVWDSKTGTLKQARNEKGELEYYTVTERYLDDVWKLHYLMPADKKENLRFNTQKPEALIKRIIEASSDEGQIVADFFSGSGTTGAIAERLGRKWIMCDLGKPACMIMRKRLIDQEVQPFLYHSVGDYQREAFEKSEFKSVGDLSRVLLGLYGAIPFTEENAPANVGYIKQSRTLVYVDSPKKLTGHATLKKAQELRETFMGGWEHVVVLGWNFDQDISRIFQAFKQIDPNIEVLVIPPDLLDQLAKKSNWKTLQGQVSIDESGNVKTPIRFSSLQYLTVKPAKKESINENEDKVTIELDNYVLLSPDALPLDETNKQKLQDIIKRDPLALIEYWSIDPDYDGKIFRSKWQDYRYNTANDNDPLHVVRKTSLILPKTEKKRRMCVKAVDVFGFESAAIIEVN